MDSQLEFSSQAFCKMILHTMKYPFSVCCGLLLSPKHSPDTETDDADGSGDQNEKSPVTKIIDVIPLLHTSHYLAPAMEIALNSVAVYTQAQELTISGYYQADKFDPPACLDVFGQRVTEKIAETYQNAVLCLVGFELEQQQDSNRSVEPQQTHICLEQHHFVDGKWRRKPSQAYSVENDIDILKKRILFTKDKLYRQIVDFDDHFNNISLDWTNAKISQKLDYSVANIC